jgi:hypothetical protein
MLQDNDGQMVTPQIADFDSIPVNPRVYLRKHGERLDMIRNEVNNNVVISQENMLCVFF